MLASNHIAIGALRRKEPGINGAKLSGIYYLGTGIIKPSGTKLRRWNWPKIAALAEKISSYPVIISTRPLRATIFPDDGADVITGVYFIPVAPSFRSTLELIGRISIGFPQNVAQLQSAFDAFSQLTTTGIAFPRIMNYLLKEFTKLDIPKVIPWGKNEMDFMQNE